MCRIRSVFQKKSCSFSKNPSHLLALGLLHNHIIPLLFSPSCSASTLPSLKNGSCETFVVGGGVRGAPSQFFASCEISWSCGDFWGESLHPPLDLANTSFGSSMMGMTIARAKRFPDSSVVDVRGVQRTLFISNGSVQDKDDKLDLGLC